MRRIKIANKFVGPSDPIFIAAEGGVNPDGDVDVGKEMIREAAKAKADAIKFMCYITEDLQTQEAQKAEYHKETTGQEESIFDLHKRLEITFDELKELQKEANKHNIIFFATSHINEKSNDFLASIKVPMIKFAAGDIINIPALTHAATKKIPLILSTGMANLQEIDTAVKAIESQGQKEMVLLHCTSNYPTKFEHVNLKAMLTMMQHYPDIPIGLSDHSLGITVPIAATALGARFIEKHFTLSKDRPGPDHRVSVDPEELRQMVEAIRNTEKSLGSSEKKMIPEEQDILIFQRKSIIAVKNIPKGTKITRDLITFKRPFKGIPVNQLDRVLGKTTTIDVKKDQRLDFKFLQ